MKTWTSFCFLFLLCLHLGSCVSPTPPPTPLPPPTCSIDGMFEHIITNVLNRYHCDGHGNKITGESRCQIKDCADIALFGHRTSGVYRVWPRGWEDCGMDVYCDLENDGGGWTVIQRRGQFGNPTDMFFKSYYHYKIGFGNLTQEFWLGNDKIHYLVAEDKYALKIVMKTKDGEKKYAHYEKFYMDDYHNNYTLSVSHYSGNAGDSLAVHNGMDFHTWDKDAGTCAHSSRGGWWYNWCHNSNLNGINYDGPHTNRGDGINWETFKGYYYSMTGTVMKVRPASYGERLAERGHALAPTPRIVDTSPAPGPQSGPDYHEGDSHKDDHHNEEQHA